MSGVSGVGPTGQPEERGPFEPFDAAKFTQEQGDSCYIDMGMFYGQIQGSCIRWWPEPVCVDKEKFDALLKQLFEHLRASGTNNIELSFAQLCDIGKLLKGEGGGSATDKITDIFKDGYEVEGTGQDFLQYLISQAHANGIKVDLSFGGALATSDDMKIQGDPAQAARDLAAFMDTYDIDAVDWDLEGGGTRIMTVNSTQDVATFFKTLHDELKKQGKESLITLEGSIHNGPKGVFAPLFAHFDAYFDGVNLMLYSTSESYLDGDNPDWGLKQWLECVSDPAQIHIGFYDKIPYEDPNSNAGKKYAIPPGLSRGEAAAFVYLQTIKDAGLSKEQMGDPFFWTDDPGQIPQDKFMTDFYAYLRSH